MLLKVGSRGKEVRELQEFLEIGADGIFGVGTKAAVQKWQSSNGLSADGIVGPVTWDTIKCIDQWGRDSRGAVATEFVLGGPSIKGNDNKYDGKMVQAFPEGGYGWHLGKNGSQHMHTHSVGIEVNNFGYIKDGKTYAGTTAHESQIVELDKPFRGYKTWHRYSDAQIEALHKWILFIAERDNIDVRAGLPSLIKEKGAEAFEWNEDAYYGKVKGLWTHTNTRKDKTDMFPQQELMDMLVSL